jgi:hypothetical protein
MVGGGYRIGNFLMAKGVKKEVNKEVKKKLQHQCPTITHLTILNLKICIHVLLIYIQSECLTLYIINKNYQ